MIHDTEIKALLEIVKGKDNVVDISGIDIQRLVHLAVRHKTVYQLLRFAQGNGKLFTKEQVGMLEERSRRVATQSLTQLYEMKKIAGILNENNIPYCCIKGPQLSRMIYGREALKDSVDIDIMLTNGEDLLKVHEILKDTGYKRSNLDDYTGKWKRKLFLTGKREVHYFNRDNRCSIDLHIRPGANTYMTAGYFKDFFRDLKTYDLEGTPVPVPGDEAYLAYLCYHGALHRFSRLAWLLDIRAFLALKHKELKFEKALSIAYTWHTERCIHLALTLIKEYWGEEYFGPVEPGRRISRLAAGCRAMLGRDVSYGISLKGRFDKVVYIMMLLRGFASKVDWVFGIFVRQVAM